MKKEEIKQLADKLFLDLPLWKRRKIFKWYRKNNWDVLGYYKECVSIAIKMCEDRDFWIDKAGVKE